MKMESKTLNAIQILSKLGRVLSKIVEICCLVGGIISVVGLICLKCIPGGGMKLGGVTVHSLIEQNTQVSMGVVCASLIVAIVMCAGEVILARYAGRYFKNELAAGTPFTFEGAGEMLRLGIMAIVIPIVTATACQIGVGIAAAFSDSFEKINLGNGGSVVLGIMFIIMSLICKYGAEQAEQERR